MGSEAQRRKIEETVVEILRNADLETTTEYSVRTMAAERLGIEISDLDHKLLIRRIVESFLLSLSSLDDKVQEQTKEVVQEQQPSSPYFDPKEVRGDGGRVICKLSDKRTVSIQNFRESALVTIRDYNQKDGKTFPSAIGISLTAKQWSAFRNSIPALEEAIVKMESRIRSEKQIEADMSNSATAFAPQGQPFEREQIEADMPNSMAAFAPQAHVRHNSVTAFAPRALVHIETTRLDGKNYHCWMHQMGFFLKQLNIAYVLTEPCPSIPLQAEASFEEIVQAKAAAQKWVGDDYICRHNILSSLSDHLFDQYSKKTYSAKELWEELKLVYDEDFGTKRSQVNKYIQFQMVDGISILEQVQELQSIADSIIASGTWINEDLHVSIIISKLPPSWNDYRVKLMHEEFLPLNVLMYNLSVEEGCRNRYKKEEHSNNARVVDSNLGNKVGQRKRETKRLCYSCGKEGHISRHCLHRKFDTREQRNGKEDAGVPVATEG